MRVLERYEDEAAMSAHMASDHFATFQQEITGVLAGAPELMRYDVEDHSQVM
ncbi:MAG: antibiotic biosynthesis monooxygenase [Natrialbaceae archaeon]|nr:antibiotic biosynthesis monooxygenase [Natrialbaceae archaeon]